jgi:hypothetical protein
MKTGQEIGLWHGWVHGSAYPVGRVGVALDLFSQAESNAFYFDWTVWVSLLA